MKFKLENYSLRWLRILRLLDKNKQRLSTSSNMAHDRKRLTYLSASLPGAKKAL